MRTEQELDLELTQGYLAGNYCNAYDTENLKHALAMYEEHSDAYLDAFVLGFLGTYTFDEMGEAQERWEEAYYSEHGQRCVELGYQEPIADDGEEP